MLVIVFVFVLFEGYFYFLLYLVELSVPPRICLTHSHAQSHVQHELNEIIFFLKNNFNLLLNLNLSFFSGNFKSNINLCFKNQLTIKVHLGLLVIN